MCGHTAARKLQSCSAGEEKQDQVIHHWCLCESCVCVGAGKGSALCLSQCVWLVICTLFVLCVCLFVPIGNTCSQPHYRLETQKCTSLAGTGEIPWAQSQMSVVTCNRILET